MHIISAHFDDFTPDWRNKKEYVQYHIFVLITSGRVRYELNSNIVYAQKSDLLYIPSGTEREAANDNGQLHQKFAVLFQSGQASQLLPFQETNQFQLIRSHNFEYMKQRFSSLYQHWVEKQPFYETITAGILTEIIGLARREAHARHISPSKQKLVNQLKDYIVAHYRNSIKVEELSTLIKRSPNYTISIYKEVTGQTPVEFMLHLRVSAALDLLQHSKMTNGQIAEYLGFYDASYFFRIFKRLTGYSPMEARQSFGVPTEI